MPEFLNHSKTLPDMSLHSKTSFEFMRLFDGKAILRISFHDMVAVSLIKGF